MGISDKEAFRILGLPLGVDKDAINDRYKSLSCKLSASKAPADKKKLEEVVAAYSQLFPQPQHRNNHTRHKANGAKSNHTLNNCDDSDDASSEDEWRVLCRNGRGSNQQAHQQLSEAERERKKAEKRRAKKKRRKEKKKLEKLENRIFNQNADDKKNDSGSGSEDEEEDEDDDDEDEDEEEEGEEGQGLDPTSAFVATAVKGRRGGKVAAAARQEKTTKTGRSEDKKSDDTNGVDGTVLQARQLAMRGNEAANVGQYSAAVRLFSDAIRLHPNDYRFFGNRSYCHHQLAHHDKALKDAEKAIKLAPQWPKGHFRRGTSLRGLGKFLEAESAFEEVLRLDPNCQEANEEIQRVRVTRIVEMGFTSRQAANAISKYVHVQPALDALLAGEFREGLSDVFYSDDEDGEGEEEVVGGGSSGVVGGGLAKRVRLLPHPIPPSASSSSTVKMNPRNPEGLTSLWVGNVLPEVTEKMLTHLFAKQGVVTSVRLLKEKYCAFVNYQDKGAAGRAMEKLQGQELCGQRLLIKFPDNPITTTLHHNAPAPRKNKSMQNGMKK